MRIASVMFRKGITIVVAAFILPKPLTNSFCHLVNTLPEGC